MSCNGAEIDDRQDTHSPEGVESQPSLDGVMEQLSSDEMSDVPETVSRSESLSNIDEAVNLAEAYKDQGNADFRSNRYHAALSSYTIAIETYAYSAVYYANRAFCHIRLENFGLAVADATKALELDPSYVKAYYRRGAAYLGMGKYNLAVRDFERVCKIHPKNSQAQVKYKECKRAATEAAFSRAIESERSLSPSQVMDWRSIPLPSSYDGPEYPESGITRDFLVQVMEWFRSQKNLPKRYATRIVLELIEILRKEVNVVEVNVAPEEEFIVCGDIHGQYYDLLNIWKMNGYPGPKNRFLFNGDFVDRGSFSAECALSLFAWKVLDPNFLILTRGNHESRSMNSIYGFQGEIIHKYDASVYELFCEAFCLLPLAALLKGDPSEQNVLVVHGGLFTRDDVTIAELQTIDRNQQPPETGLMCEMLWSDPQKDPGRSASRRGVGVSFGPDVTRKFLQQNDLKLLIRSHEVKDEGYEVECDGQLVTVFSAPRYCDQLENKGAFIRLNHRLEPKYCSFESVPHPPVRAMSFARPLMQM